MTKDTPLVLCMYHYIISCIGVITFYHFQYRHLSNIDIVQSIHIFACSNNKHLLALKIILSVPNLWKETKHFIIFWLLWSNRM